MVRLEARLPAPQAQNPPSRIPRALPPIPDSIAYRLRPRTNARIPPAVAPTIVRPAPTSRTSEVNYRAPPITFRNLPESHNTRSQGISPIRIPVRPAPRRIGASNRPRPVELEAHVPQQINARILIDNGSASPLSNDQVQNILAQGGVYSELEININNQAHDLSQIHASLQAMFDDIFMTRFVPTFTSGPIGLTRQEIDNNTRMEPVSEAVKDNCSICISDLMGTIRYVDFFHLICFASFY